MPTVRDLTYEVLQRHGMTTIFGNPGSNELPFLAGMPDGFRYVLALHEGAAVGMADGYAQATGRPVLVNLHAASGTGNAMGALTNAAYSRSPLVLLAGQQVRGVVGMEGMLASVDAPALTRPLTGYSAEPLCAADVPRSLSQAVFEAQYGRRGPAYVSVPYDDWEAPAPRGTERLLTRSIQAPFRLGDDETGRLADRLASARRPALVLGGDLDGKADPMRLVDLAERLDADVWVAPSTWRMPYPHRHRLFRGVLPAGIASISACLAPHDVALVLGAPVFRYHQHEPGDYLTGGTTLLQVTDDTGTATRAPVGEAFIADPARVVQDLVDLLVGDREDLTEDNGRWTTPPEPAPGRDGRLSPAEVFATLRRTMPADTAYVVESTSTNADWWEQMDLRRPRSYYFPASGGLGFGLPAAVGVALAENDLGTGRRVVGVIGDGSAQYGIQALWTAAQLSVPVTVLVLRNGTYGALRWFAKLLGAEKSPGLDIPDIDTAAIARGYGTRATTVTDVDSLSAALAAVQDEPAPYLIQVDTTPTRPDGQPLTQEEP